MDKIIGRYTEIKELKDIYSSGNPEFVVVYGRRRVGKTFLIRQMFENDFAFHHTGLSSQEMEGSTLLTNQLLNFASSLRRYGYELKGSFNDWLTAFDALKDYLQKEIKKNPNKRQVVFIDELPWMDTPRSMFVSALEHFWNGWGAGISQLMLIVCGSATAWISDKLLHNKGGLYNRRTREIKLHPFTLKETELFLKEKNILLNRYSILQIYMMLGGIPYYLSFIPKGKSTEQLVDYLFDDKSGKLRDEIANLFESLFTNHEDCLKIMQFLIGRKEGYTRKEIAEATQIPYGGGLSITLAALVESDFITKYTYYGKPTKEERYRITDLFSIFQFKIIKKKKGPDSKNWNDHIGPKALTTLYGISFEILCWNHIFQIKKALGILSVHTEEFSWRIEGKEKDHGAQIDLMIRRADNIFNLCEMKFCLTDYPFSKNDAEHILKRIESFQKTTGCHESIFPVLVTTYGMNENKYSDIIQHVITMDNLFD